MNFLLIILIIFSFDNVNSADNCVTPITGSNLCQTCAANYVLNKDRTCSQCGTGQVIYNNYCFTTIDHCVKYTLYQEGQKCDRCADDYRPNEDNSACRLYIEYCAEYENNEKCQSCETGYLLKSDHTECIESENCARLDTNNKCTQCEDGFRLITVTGSDPYCSPTIENCQEYNDDDPLVCDECISSYKTSADSHSCEYDACIYTKEGEEDKCTSCKDDYKLREGTCGKIEGCQEYEDSSLSCKNCNGYGEKDGICYKIDNCREYDSPDGSKCKTCINDGYTLSPSKGKCLATISHCKTYDDDGCSECDDDFYLKEGNCENDPIPHCINQVNDECQQCETYYIKNNKICVACDNTEGKSCGITIENCSTYSLNEGIVACTRCSSGFTLSYGVCINGKAENGNTISSTIQYCVYYTTESKCGKCFPGYELINDKCYPCPGPYTNGNGLTCSLPHLNCANYDNSGNCIACPTGYQFTRNHQYCIEEGTNDPTKNNNSCVLNLNILILILFALLL